MRPGHWNAKSLTINLCGRELEIRFDRAQSALNGVQDGDRSCRRLLRVGGPPTSAIVIPNTIRRWLCDSAQEVELSCLHKKMFRFKFTSDDNVITLTRDKVSTVLTECQTVYRITLHQS